MEAPVLETELLDLALFSEREDLIDASLSMQFNSKALDQQINHSAHRALQVCNATAQLMLSRYRSEKIDDISTAQIKAEHIAYDLGDEEYDADFPCSNPFDEPLLQKAWQAGYDNARHEKRLKPMLELEKKYWEEGVDTEDTRSVFELCALQLYKIAARLEQGDHASRAKRLALEMCRYHEGESPTRLRQQEIELFMARQAERIADEIDL